LCDLALTDELVNDILAGGDVSLFLTAADDHVGLQCGAKDNKTPDSRPYLTVVADLAGTGVIPEPASAALLAAGIVALCRNRRETNGGAAYFPSLLVRQDDSRRLC